jgi:UDP-N-acetylmuramoyl-tripeptide--D-alanyl-D-alanine ligase
MYSPSYPSKLGYMLQMVGYSPKEFWEWWTRVQDFRVVDKRRQLQPTRAGKLAVLSATLIILFQLLLSVGLTVLSVNNGNVWLQLLGFVLLISYPFTAAIGLLKVVWLGDTLVVRPRHKKRIQHSASIFKEHPGTIIAVAGSYGKTTMKEVLKTVLAEGGKTAATPGNKNVAISHARFAESLKGDEKFVIVEFGEGYKGDVARFCETVDPDIGIVTGLAPNHLDEYGTVDELKRDLLSLPNYLKEKNSYICCDTPELANSVGTSTPYGVDGVLGWKVHDVKNTVEGLRFDLKKSGKTIKVHSGLVGRHLIATLALAAVLAHELGLSNKQIEDGLSKTLPFEHRLQPRNLHGAWIIDDTYNGSIEGIRAGLALLSDLKTTGKKIYVTPGLVGQGEETEAVHKELGELIAKAKPDMVVLMSNSTTEIIRESLEVNGYTGLVEIVDDPLSYYTNIDVTLAKGDIVLMQNDWTDNYA